MNQELTDKIKDCKSIEELDSIRKEVAKQMLQDGPNSYKEIQKVFIKQKNKLLRIPRKDRL